MATEAFEDIVEDFEFLDDWEDRYAHVIDLGRAMDPLEDALKVPATKVEGCASQVWLMPEIEGGTFRFRGDSDALIVKGLAAIVLSALNQQSPQGIHDYDMDGFFGRIDLLSHLSPTRGNGLRAMVAKIRHQAEQRIT